MSDRLRAEDGFTLVEVLVATLILALGATAVFLTMAAAIHNVQRSRDTQAAISIAQQEMEKVHSLEFAKISILVNASNPAPAHSTETASPLFRVNAAGTKFNLNRTGTAEEANLIESSSGEVAPTGTFSVNGVTGKIYRFVVSRNDVPCAGCGSGQEYKRVVIITRTDKLANQASQGGYYELQSDFVNPAS